MRTLIAQRAEQAAKYIEHGWTRHALEFDDRVCAVGALNKSFTGDAGDAPGALKFGWSDGKFREWRKQCKDYELIVELTIRELTPWWRLMLRRSPQFTSGQLIEINDRRVSSGKRIAEALHRVAQKLDAEAQLTQREMELAGGPSL